MADPNTASGLKIIIDSNVFIAIEDHDEHGSVETLWAAEFVQLASRLHASLIIASGTKDDILRGNAPRRQKRLAQLAKYHVLEKAAIRSDLAPAAGFPPIRSPNDESDLEILGALDSGAADWLVTDDGKLRRRASRAGYADNVFSLQDALETIRGFIQQPTTTPNIKTVQGYQVDLSARVFDSIKMDYPEFPDWWRLRVAYDGRDILIVGDETDPEGIAVLKIEFDHPYALEDKVLKICTFKVEESFSGSRRGELLLSASIDYARKNKCSHIYSEVLPTKYPFIEWLQTFGFEPLQAVTTARNETVMLKTLVPNSVAISPSAILDFAVTYGPRALVLQNPLIVPIMENWRRRLLPEPEMQPELFQYNEACGNAIRKAYLCNASIRTLAQGDTLLFYESHGRSSVVSIGVLESTLVSRDQAEILRFVGNRTVYSPEEIAKLCASRDVLAFRFRFDRTLAQPWSREALNNAQAMTGCPQSIQRVRQEGIEWVRIRLAG